MAGKEAHRRPAGRLRPAQRGAGLLAHSAKHTPEPAGSARPGLPSSPSARTVISLLREGLHAPGLPTRESDLRGLENPAWSRGKVYLATRGLRLIGGAAKAKVRSRGAPPGSTLWTCYPQRAEQPLLMPPRPPAGLPLAASLWPVRNLHGPREGNRRSGSELVGICLQPHLPGLQVMGQHPRPAMSVWMPSRHLPAPLSSLQPCSASWWQPCAARGSGQVPGVALRQSPSVTILSVACAVP